MKLVITLIWPVITYGVEGWKDDEIRLEAAEMWYYRRMLRIKDTQGYTGGTSNKTPTRCPNVKQIAFFGHGCINNRCKHAFSE